MRESILFVSPDYHCSFHYRDELRRMGWRADIHVSEGYPEKLLYTEKDVIRSPIRPVGAASRTITGIPLKVWFNIVKGFWAIRHVITYKYFFCYGGIDQFPLLWRNISYKGSRRSFTLSLAKLLGIKIIHLPSGCLQQETKENFSKLDEGNVCSNCGWSSEVCNDEKNTATFNFVRRYADMMVGTGEMDSSQFKMTHFKYKSLDLNKWKSGLEVPKEHLLPKTSKLRILHSFIDKNRTNKGNNIKGTPFVVSAIERLEAEGHEVEYMYLHDIPSRDMRFYQAQADIVVEQLIYGWWGSNGVETMALGKPVVCYLRPSWKECFFKTFPEYKVLPIVEADTQNIYEVLKELVTDKEYRERKGKESREFAERHFDIRKNAKEMVCLLEKL